MTLADEDLTPEEVAAITGTPKPARQAAELAKRGIAYVYTGSRVKVQRAVALAYELLPQSQNRGIDFSKVR